MTEKARGNLSFDPRTGIVLLVYANLITFFQNSMLVEAGWVCFLVFLMFLYGLPITAFKWMVSFLLILLLQYIILPSAPMAIASAFIILINYTRRVFPCLVVGALLLKTISLRRFILALRKLHMPQKLIIPISVTIRYFPAIREELGYIRDAMRLKNIKFKDRFEAVTVPLLISATATAEELSAAAVTRGIENPIPKTSIIVLRFGILDKICLLVGFVFTISVFLLK